MIVSFCGHSKFPYTDEHKKKILQILKDIVGDKKADMFLGGYGNFDNLAYQCCKEYKKLNPNISLVFVAPYFSVDYQKNHLESLKDLYDSIVYPNIEEKPLRFAIVYRNRYMMDAADFVISNVSHAHGGAYTTYAYAKRKKKVIFNICEKPYI